MPARNRRQVHSPRSEGRRKVRVGKLLKILIVLLIPIFFFAFLVLNTNYWNSDQKLSMAIETEDGGVDVAVFDPTDDSIITISIPSSVEVESSRHLGTWRLKSIARLGEKENLKGTLTAETITKHFKFPVFVWAESKAKGFVNGNFGELVSAFISPYRTNLGLGDRLRIALFSLNVKNYKKEKIDLTTTRYLKSEMLKDGEEGYVVSGSIPTNLTAIFASPEFSEESGRVQIVDQTGENIGETLGEVIEVLGLKVVSVKKEKEEDTECHVSGKRDVPVNMIASLFGCTKSVSSELGFDVVITLGKDFASRF